jgi:hypothetical protein
MDLPMRIELTEQQRRVVQNQEGNPVDVFDPDNDRTYVLIGREQYEHVLSLLPSPPTIECPGISAVVPPGIHKSRLALQKALPDLLDQRHLSGQWVAFHGDEQIGIARQEQTLIRECIRRGLSDDAYYVGWIDASELIEIEEIEDPKHEHFDCDSVDAIEPTK